MPTIFQHVATLIGRMLMSLIFIASGVSHLTNWRASTEYMTSKGMAMENLLGNAAGTVFVHAMLALAVLLLLGGGLSVLLGFRARLGAVLLIAFLLPVTVIFHNFWAIEPSAIAQYGEHVKIYLRQDEMINFAKNVGLIGGLLMVFAFGSGGFSAEVLMPRRRTAGQF